MTVLLLIFVLVLSAAVAIQYREMLRLRKFLGDAMAAKQTAEQRLNDAEAEIRTRCDTLRENHEADLVCMQARYDALMVKYDSRWFMSGSEQVERAGAGEQTDQRTSEAGYEIEAPIDGISND